MNRKGFTLIELLAVITIMGILLLAGILITLEEMCLLIQQKNMLMLSIPDGR